MVMAKIAAANKMPQAFATAATDRWSPPSPTTATADTLANNQSYGQIIKLHKFLDRKRGNHFLFFFFFASANIK